MNYVGNQPAPPGFVLIGDANAVGAIIWSHKVPDGSYLQLNGQVVSKTAYPDLWLYAQSFLTADQTTNPGLYRSVDANTFALPKFDGLFIRATGQVDASHVAAALGVKQADDNKAHTHTESGHFPHGTVSGPDMSNAEQGATTGSSGGPEARPINIALVPCVKALRTVLVPTASMPDFRLLDTKDASNSATLDFTASINADYETYLFTFRHLTPATADQPFHMRCSTDGGATYDAAAGVYLWAYNMTQSSTNSPSTSNGTSHLLGNTAPNTAADGGTNGKLYLFSPSTIGKAKHYQSIFGGWRTATSFNMLPQTGAYYGGSPTYPAVNAVRFYFASGNIASGRIKMYGIR